MINDNTAREELVKRVLITNVPRFIRCIRDRGGVQQEEWDWLKDGKDAEDPDTLEYVLNNADEFLIYPKNQEAYEKGVSALILALAIMSFIPGGVRFMGLHFCAELPNFLEYEADSCN